MNYQDMIFKKECINIPYIGKVIPINTLCNFLLCKYNYNFTCKVELLKNKFMIEHDNKEYFIISEYENFLKFIIEKVDFDKSLSYFPINLYTEISKLDLEFKTSKRFKKIIDILIDFKNYLISLSENDNDINILLNIFWKEKFNGLLTSINEKPFLLSFIFRIYNNEFISLNFSDIETNNELILSLDTPNDVNKDKFNKIITSWKKEFLLKNEEKFIITNLIQVTGNENMAYFIYKSHQSKSDHIINISDINNIIEFKNIISRNKYIDTFKDMYVSDKLYKEINNELFLNFEGFNKYLLNIDLKLLKSFSDKEFINDMYYNITKKLIDCYQELYSSK